MANIRKNFRYKIVKNFFTKEELNVLQSYCKIVLQDPAAFKSHKGEPCFALSFYNDKLMSSMSKLKKELLEKETGLELLETYTFWRWYGFGSSLEMHKDRPACEISVTACIYKTDDWPLVIEGNDVEIETGDALLYLGVEDEHGRKNKYTGDGLAQVFIHYVDKHGPFTHHANDRYTKEQFKKFSDDDLEYINGQENK